MALNQGIAYSDLLGTRAHINARTYSESESLESFLRRPEWQLQAACRGKPTDWWFPGKGHTTTETHAAKAICGGCPVREECLEYAVTVIRRPDGIWGGLTEKQRKSLSFSRPKRFRQRADAQHGTKSRFLAGCECRACERANERSTHDKPRKRGAA